MPRGVKKVVVEELPEEVVVAEVGEEGTKVAGVISDDGFVPKNHVEEVVVEAPSRPTAAATGKWEKVRHEGKFYMASPEGQIVTGGTENENQIDDMVMKLNNKRR